MATSFYLHYNQTPNKQVFSNVLDWFYYRKQKQNQSSHFGQLQHNRNLKQPEDLPDVTGNLRLAFFSEQGSGEAWSQVNCQAATASPQFHFRPGFFHSSGRAIGFETSVFLSVLRNKIGQITNTYDLWLLNIQDGHQRFPCLKSLLTQSEVEVHFISTPPSPTWNRAGLWDQGGTQ